MDPKQPVVLQLLESLKESYLSSDYKTCQQLLGQLKARSDLIHFQLRPAQQMTLATFFFFLQEIVNQKAALDTKPVNASPREQLDDFFKLPVELNSVVPNPLDAEHEQDAEHEDFRKIPYDGEWITKTNCVEQWKGKDSDEKEDEDYVVDEKDGDAKEDEEEEDASDADEDEEYVVNEEEENDDSDAEEEDDDSDADEDEEYVGDEEEDDDSDAEDEEEIQRPLRRSSRIKKQTDTK